MNKRIAVTLYVIYSVLLVLIITYASGVGKKITRVIKDVIFKSSIDDVVLNIDYESYLTAGEKYDFYYTVVGKYTGDGKIVLESTVPEVLSVNESAHTISVHKDFEGDEIDVEIIITSKADESFEKKMSFTVRKLYPKADDVKISYTTESGGLNSSEVKLGMELYSHCSIPDKKYINEYRMMYDPEYIRYDEERGVYVAIKETPNDVKLSFTAVYPNGVSVSTKSFSIVPYTEVEFFDEIRVGDEAAEEIYLKKNEMFLPILYADGKVISSMVDVSYTNPLNVSVTASGNYKLDEVGDYIFTFTLPNGFSKKLTVHVRNVMAIPEVKSNVKIEGHKITVLESDEPIGVEFIYPKGVTFVDPVIKCEGDSATVSDFWKGFYIRTKGPGETTVRFVWDDGYERLEDTYTIEVVKNTSIVSRLGDMIGLFVAKILGHSVLFAFLAFFTLNMFKHLEFKRKWLEVLIYLISVLPTAMLTEFIQSFQPTRHAQFTDVLINVCGFLVGTVVCILVSATTRRVTYYKG